MKQPGNGTCLKIFVRGRSKRFAPLDATFENHHWFGSDVAAALFVGFAPVSATINSSVITPVPLGMAKTNPPHPRRNEPSARLQVLVIVRAN